MIRINVKYFSYFKELFGSSEKALELPDGTSIDDLLHVLCNSDKKSQNIYDDDSGRLKYYVNIMLKSNRIVSFPESINTKLKNGDIVSIFPALTGG